ncbi:hypothetical protein MESS4_510101 [Mesorhizobium sp. STM 4661]|nr:hypothetical protein MESS4_510101 [Mesorhizobium sp. STM 4661]
MAKDPNITIKQDDVERELFMSFGLLNELSILIGDPGQIAAVPVNPEMRRSILLACLAQRKKSGKVEKPVADFDDLDISISDVEAILAWTMDHLMDFFVRSLKKVVQVTETHKTDLASLASSLAGSPASASKTA